MLYIGNHDRRRIEIKLLNRVVRTKGEQAGTWTPKGKALDVFQGRDIV